MKYKGFVIVPVYAAGSDFTVTPNNENEIRPRRPRKEDIDYYEILDPMQDMNRWIAEFTVEECKATIRTFLEKVNMKSNLPKEWAKIEGLK